MSNEEQKAIELLKSMSYIENGYDLGDLSYEEIKTILNIIKNQQKELERIKSIDIYIILEEWETGQLISKQKIKDKIKELYEEKCSDDDENFTFREIDITQNKIDILQELLEDK